MGKIHHLALIVAAIVYSIWGAVWFIAFDAAWSTRSTAREP